MAPAPGMVDNIGMLPLGDRGGDCPGVMQDCGSGCVDTLSDDANCGGCGPSFACAAGELPPDPYGTLVPIHCVAGECRCDDSQDDRCASGACANVLTDATNCGGCGTFCSENEDCVDGRCVQVASCASDGDCPMGSTCDTATGTCGGGAITCPAGQIPCNGDCILEGDTCGGSVGGLDCGFGLTCPGGFGAESSALGFLGCCGQDSGGVVSCGVESGAPAPLANACASTEVGTFAPGSMCQDETLMLGGTSFDGFGCCRSDSYCGLVLMGHEDLGCILRSDVSSSLPAVRCSGGFGVDAGVGGAGGGAGAGTGGSGGAAGGPADAGAPIDAGL